MGCVLQPGDVIADLALKPGQTTSDAVQPSQIIDECAAAFTLNLSDVNSSFNTADPNPNDAELGYELQGDGNAYIIEQPDTSGGPPNFIQIFGVTDWIDDKGEAGGIFHARMNQNSGDVLDGQSSPLNVWRQLGVDSFIFVLSGNGAFNTFDFNGTAEISDDGGATTIDSATIILQLNIDP
jgi:hypothetical protein